MSYSTLPSKLLSHAKATDRNVVNAQEFENTMFEGILDLSLSDVEEPQ